MATDERLQIIIDALYLAGDEFSQLKKDLGAAEVQTKKTSKGMDMLKKALMGVAVAGAALATRAIVKFAKEAILLSARVETLGVVTETLGRNIGKSKDEIRAIEKSIEDMGITTEKSRQSVAMMIQSQIDLSHASKLARMAQDAAVIAGTNSSEAFQRLVNVITTGNTRMARTLGLQVNFNAGYMKLAKTLGKTTEELTDLERVQARTNTVMDRGETIAGAYTAAMETAGKQLTSLPRYFDDLKVALGDQFQDELKSGIGLVGKLTLGLTAFFKSVRPVKAALEAQVEALKAGDISYEDYKNSVIAAGEALGGHNKRIWDDLVATEGLQSAIEWLTLAKTGLTLGAVHGMEVTERELLLSKRAEQAILKETTAAEAAAAAAEKAGKEAEEAAKKTKAWIDGINPMVENMLGDVAGKLDWMLLTGGSAERAKKALDELIGGVGELGDEKGMALARHDALELAAAILDVKTESGQMYESTAIGLLMDDFKLTYAEAQKLLGETTDIESALSRLAMQEHIIALHYKSRITGTVPPPSAPDPRYTPKGAGAAMRASGGDLGSATIVGEEGFEAVIKHNGKYTVVPHDATKWMLATGLISADKALAYGGQFDTGDIYAPTPEFIDEYKKTYVSPYVSPTAPSTQDTSVKTANAAAEAVKSAANIAASASTTAEKQSRNVVTATAAAVETVRKQIALDNAATRLLAEQQIAILKQLATAGDIETGMEAAVDRANA